LGESRGAAGGARQRHHRTAVPSASGLAAGSLSGLAALTLAFGLLLATANAGLVVVGAAQRRRPLMALAVLAVLGATMRQRSTGSGTSCSVAWSVASSPARSDASRLRDL
jgi:hypothetical protein